ncbi:MAG TPA: ABC transporter permease DevC [Candidatus Dormibacteraeota bacterium]|nr:ABC transporter permease DevC [Candidatus Dormibacteraeota bacterium]
MTRGVPLAWLQLRREKLRLVVALAGVAFAVILIFMQLGFRAAMFKSAVRFHEALDGDLFLISPTFDFLPQPKSFSRRHLYQALAWPGVASVTPVYLEVTVWKNPDTGKTRSILLIGIDPADPGIRLPGVAEQRDLIRRADVVLFDRDSRPEYGAIAERFAAGGSVAGEIANRRAFVHGLFTFGTSFGVDGTVLTSDMNFLRFDRTRPLGLIDIGVVRLAPGVDPAATRDALRGTLPNDVLVLTREDFIAREQHYWDTSTPIGYVFTFGVIMGFVVGAIIVYQILFADVSDHLAEYATLKAMGYPDRYLFGVVFQEAIILAVLGFLPGLAICTYLYRVAGEATRLPLRMTAPTAGFVLALAIVMCCLSGAIALRKIRSADPAEIF